MDLNFYSLLRSVAAAEMKHDLRVNKPYDVATLELEHPRNVITVAPLAAKAPPPVPGETRVSKLSDAIRTAVLRAANGGSNGRSGCSIIIHEGIYVDAFETDFEPPNEDFSLEIIGVKEAVFSGCLTLKNILVFDLPRQLKYAAFEIVVGELRLDRVKIFSPQTVAIYLMKTTLSLVKSTIVGECDMAIYARESCLHIDDSVISSSSNPRKLLHLYESKFEAKNTRFASNAGGILSSQTRGTVEDCELTGSLDPTDLSSGPFAEDEGLKLVASSNFTLRRSTVRNFPYLIHSKSSGSFIFASSCSFSNCFAAFDFISNSNGVVEDCRMGGLMPFVATFVNNVEGEILFRHNRLPPGAQPSFQKDSKSSLPRHDFRNVDTRVRENIFEEKPSRSRAEQAADTERVYAEMDAALALGDLDLVDGELQDKIKHCGRCGTIQMPDTEKFKYCVRCEQVCYCSKDCQIIDWPDHKLECRPRP